MLTGHRPIMQGDHLKRGSVNLGTHVPLGRKFIVIREGKRTLMLKLHSGSQSGYSIESASVKTRSTRSDKKHFLPKIVNGFGGMNDQKSKGDHVAVMKSNLGGGTTQRPKNFAKKSTGNNIRRTLHQAKSTKENLAHQLLHKESHNPARRSRSRSPARVSQKPQKHSDVTKVLQGLSKEKDAPRSNFDTSLREKDRSDGKLIETTQGKEISKGLTRQKDASTKDKDRRDGKPRETAQRAEKEGASRSLEKALSIVSRKEKQKNIDHANDKLETEKSSTKVFKRENDHVDIKMSRDGQHLTKETEDKKPAEEKGPISGQRGREHGECSKGMQMTKQLNTVAADEIPKPIKSKHDLKPNGSTDSKKVYQLSTSNRSSSNESSSNESHRRRPSTPTPESPVKKSVLNKLSRKRHRSASPKIKVSTDDTKHEDEATAQNVRTSKDQIRLDTTKFKKVMMNAINQRKDNKFQKGSPGIQDVVPDKPSLPTIELEGEDKENADENLQTTKEAIEIRSPERLAPSPKRPKLSATKGGHQVHVQSSSRSSDSEDGLTKLMKDFQSAMSSSPRQESKKPSSKENAVKGSKCSPKKTTDSSTNPPVQSPDHVSELDALQTEAVSSDEDFEFSQEVKVQKLTNDVTPEKGGPHPVSAKVDMPNEEDKELKQGVSIDNFLIVDEVGYTPVKSPSPSKLGVKSDAISSTRNNSDLTPSIKSAENRQSGCEMNGTNKEERKTELLKDPVLTKENVEASKELFSSPKDTASLLNQQGKGIRRGLKRTYDELENLNDKGAKTQAIYTSTLVQTDFPVMSKKEQSCQTQTVKPDVKHQLIQFDAQLPEIDPEEITPILSAMLESECEEKERLKKSLEDSMKKEEKWRGMVNDLCRQLRELRQQLEKKQDKPMKDMHTKTDTEMSALPCIVSSQSTQTEYGKDIGNVRYVSSQRSKSESPSNTNKMDNIIVVDGKTNPVHSKGSNQLQTGNVKMAKVSQIDVPEKVMTPPSAAAVPSSSPAKVQNVTIPQKNTDEVIDLTGSEDPTSLASKQTPKTTALKKSPVGPAPNVNVLSAKPHAMKMVSPTIAQLNLMRNAQMQQQHIPSLRTLPPEKTPQSLPSTVQGVPRSTPNKLSQNAAAPVTAVNRTSTQGVNHILVSQPNATVPPPLHPAPNVTGAVYQAAPTQLPVLRQIGNFNMILQNQAQPSLLTQQVMQPQVFTAQQQQVQNTVLMEDLRRGVISTNQGKTNIIIPRTTPQTIPIRVQQQLQAKTQLQSKTQIVRLENQRVQQPQLTPVVSLQGQRFPQQSTTYTSTVPPVGQVSNPQPTRSIVQHNDVPNVALQPNNSLRLVNGTWFPSTVQKLPQAKPKPPAQTTVARSPPKHPAALPILQSFSSIGKGSALLPPPSIRISKSDEGVVLSWNINVSQEHPAVKKYFLYAYQVLNTPPSTSHWKRIGEVGALPPPMACTLNQFQPGSTYFLAICAVDVYERAGEFSKTEKVLIPTK